MTGLKVLNHDTITDALAVIARGFSPEDCQQAKKIFDNPLVGTDEGCGDVAYYEDCPVGVQLAIKRKLIWDGTLIFGTIGAMLVMDAGVPPVLLVALMKSTKGARWNRKLYYANTAIQVSMKMNRMLGVSGCGTASCETVRFAVLKPVGFLNFLLKGWLPEWLIRADSCLWRNMARLMFREVPIESRINEKEIDDFWSSYCASNHGVTSSRSAQELKWAFESDIAAGKAIMIAERHEDKVVGFIVVKETRRISGRWMVVDWIALNNDPSILLRLLKKARMYLARDRSAFILESIGFPMRVQGVIHSCLPLTRKAPNNAFIYQAFDSDLDAAIKSDVGWFFGPYDGDRFLS